MIEKRCTRVLPWVALFLFAQVGCGVRGRPQPPETPPELGRGQPSFKRATEEFAFPEVPQVGATPTPPPSSQKESR